jgi:hypothetical protein
MTSTLEPRSLGPAPEEAIHIDPPTIKAALQAHAREHGYAIICNSSTSSRILYVCSKHGVYDSRNQGNVHQSKRRKGTGTTKTNCMFRVIARPIPGPGPGTTLWKVTVLNNDHNHEAVLSLAALPHHHLASLSIEEHTKVSDISMLGHSPSTILAALRLANLNTLLVMRDIYNLLYSIRLDELGGFTPVEWLLNVFTNCLLYLSSILLTV